jgi:hypothetical protein
MIILAIIFPKAHFADFVSGAPVKSFVATTGTPVGLLAFLRLGHVFKHSRSLHQPTRKVPINVSALSEGRFQEEIVPWHDGPARLR